MRTTDVWYSAHQEGNRHARALAPEFWAVELATAVRERESWLPAARKGVADAHRVVTYQAAKADTLVVLITVALAPKAPGEI